MAAPVRPQAHIPIDRTRHVNKILIGVAALSIASIFLGIFGKNSWGATGLKSALYGGTAVGVLTILAALYKKFAIDNRPWVAVRNKEGRWEWMAISSVNNASDIIGPPSRLFRPNEFLVYWDNEKHEACIAYKEPDDQGGYWNIDRVDALLPFGYRQVSPLSYYFGENLRQIHHRGILSALQLGEWVEGTFINYDDAPSKLKYCRVLKEQDKFTEYDRNHPLLMEKFVINAQLYLRLAHSPIPLESREAEEMGRFVEEGECFTFVDVSDLDRRMIGSASHDAKPVTYKTLFDRQQQDAMQESGVV